MIITPKPAVFLRRKVRFAVVFLVRLFYTFCCCVPAQSSGIMSKTQTATIVVIGVAGNMPAYRRLLEGNRLMALRRAVYWRRLSVHTGIRCSGGWRSMESSGHRTTKSMLKGARHEQ